MELQEFIDKFAEEIEIEEPSAITGDTVIRELEEWNSLKAMLLIAFIDEEFGKEFSSKNLKSCVTVNDIYKFATA